MLIPIWKALCVATCTEETMDTEDQQHFTVGSWLTDSRRTELWLYSHESSASFSALQAPQFSVEHSLDRDPHSSPHSLFLFSFSFFSFSWFQIVFLSYFSILLDDDLSHLGITLINAILGYRVSASVVFIQNIFIEHRLQCF